MRAVGGSVMSVPTVPNHQGFNTPAPGPAHPNNGDENLTVPCGARFVGNFHRTLPHNQWGEIADANQYNLLVYGLTGPQSEAALLIEQIAKGATDSAGLAAPLTGRANERLLPLPSSLTMPPAPKVQGASIGAEMVELYWMALLRDLSFAEFAGNPLVDQASADIAAAFNSTAHDTRPDPGEPQPKLDFPSADGHTASISSKTLFRCGLPGEDQGPNVSQFFLKNIRYGAQYIDQRVQPYKSADGNPRRDYLSDRGRLARRAEPRPRSSRTALWVVPAGT